MRWYPSLMACFNRIVDRQLSASVVLHHSDLEHLRLTLTSLVRAAEMADVVPYLVVVDQSLDGDYSRQAQALVQDLWHSMGDAEFLIAADNKGYGAGHNRALKQGLCTFHLILNPDVALDERALEQGLATLRQDQSITLLAPRSVDESGREEYLAKSMPSVGVLALRAFGSVSLRRRFSAALARYECHDLPSEGAPHPITLASGCCMLVRGDSLQQVDGFNEAFFLYFEDYDLSLRLTRYGRICRDPQMIIRHYGGEAARKGWRHIVWFMSGGIRFFNRWGWRFSG